MGSIDAQFGANRKKVIEETKRATEIWNKAYGTPLFEYSDDTNLVINLIFDERQRKINEIAKQETTVNLDKYQMSATLQKYEEQYNMLDAAVTELNKQVEYWNSHGGATPQIYNKLIDQQDKLNAQIEELNQFSGSLSAAGAEVNVRIDALNETISDFNKLLDLYPEEGVYLPYEEIIEIYFYDSESRFIHTVAHELGHALGLDHVMEDNAILHPTTSENTALTTGDIEELTRFCEERNRFEFISRNWETLLHNTIQKISAK